MGVIEGKKSLVDIIFLFLICVIFGLFTLICIFPFYYIFINTISSNDLVASGKIMFLPKAIHFTNYLEVIKLRGIGNATMVSILRTVIGTTANLFGSSFLAYLFTKRKMWKRKFFYRFVIVTMYLNAGLIPWFLNMKNLGLLNSFWAYIIPTLISPFNVILVKTYMESISPSLEESAELDGAGIFTVYSQIILPISIPILATLAIFTAVGHWNSYLDTLFLMTNSRLFTLQYVLYNFLNEVNAIAQIFANNPSNSSMDPSKMLTPTAIRMTVSMVVVLPILFVYPIGQKYFLKGIMIGAVKG